ncbi:MAG: NfeD family protein [Thermotogae bacterium]|nr:NfeD family protein [Thermotogota bacterium]
MKLQKGISTPAYASAIIIQGKQEVYDQITALKYNVPHWSQQVWSIVFLIVGVSFIVSELGLPTNFEFFAVGVGFVLVSFMTYFGVPWPIQAVIFILVVTSIIAVAYKLSSDDEGPPPTAFTPQGLIGKVGKVVEADPYGYVVRVEGEEWRAESDDPLKVGDEVEVVEILGAKLKVKKTKRRES